MTADNRTLSSKSNGRGISEDGAERPSDDWRTLLRVMSGSAQDEVWTYQRCPERGQKPEVKVTISRNAGSSNGQLSFSVWKLHDKVDSFQSKNEVLFGAAMDELAKKRDLDFPGRIARIYLKAHVDPHTTKQEQAFAGLNLDDFLEMLERSDQKKALQDPRFHLAMWLGVIKALRDVHSLGWVHADAKLDNFTVLPQVKSGLASPGDVNVFVNLKDRVYVIDFDASLLGSDERDQQFEGFRGLPHVQNPSGNGQVEYVSPAYTEAFNTEGDDRNQRLAKVRNLDWRVDFFSVAAFVKATTSRHSPDCPDIDRNRFDALRYLEALPSKLLDSGWKTRVVETPSAPIQASEGTRTTPVALVHHDQIIAEIDNLLRPTSDYSGEFSATVNCGLTTSETEDDGLHGIRKSDPRSALDKPVSPQSTIISALAKWRARDAIVAVVLVGCAVGALWLWRSGQNTDVPLVPMRLIGTTDPGYAECTKSSTMQQFNDAVKLSQALPPAVRSKVEAAFGACNKLLSAPAQPNPVKRQVQSYAAEYAIHLGKNTEASRFAKELVADFPADFVGPYLLGKIKLLQADLDGAWSHLQDAGKLGLPAEAIDNEPGLFAPLRAMPGYENWHATLSKSVPAKEKP